MKESGDDEQVWNGVVMKKECGDVIDGNETVVECRKWSQCSSCEL